MARSGLTALFDALPSGVFVLRVEDANRAESLRIVFANAASEWLLGVERAALMGELLVDAFPNTAEAEIYWRVAVEQRSHDLGVVAYRDERVNYRFSATAHPLAPDEVVVVFENLSAPPTRVTELAAIVESAEDAILSKDLEGTILTWNDAATRLYGYSAAEAVGQKIAMLLPDDRPHELDDILARLRSGERLSQFETVRRCKDGSLVEVSLAISPLWGARGTVVGAATIAREIGTRKRAEEQIREPAALVATSEDAILSRSLDGVIRSWNPAAERLLGYSAEEVVGTRIEIVAPDAANVDLDELRASLSRGERHKPFETRLVRKDGSEVEVSVATSGIRDRSGEVIAIAGVIRDLTEHLRLEEQLRQSQKLEAIGSLAGGVAHDFNNVLTIIRNTSQLLGSGLEDEKARERLQQIDAAVDHAASLTQQLLAFSRRQILRPEAVDLNNALQHTLGLVRRLIEARVHIEHRLGARLTPIEIDPAQLQQLILNLSINARDAMPEGGLLSFRTANANIDDHYARGRPDVAAGSYVLLEVTDTGLGMEPATLERIFEPFYTTKRTGTGLGLSTVFGIVKQSRGHIAAYSEPGIGTTFKVYLRPAGAAVAVPKPAPSPIGSLEGDETILVVEDSPMLRPMLAEMLESYGYSVLVAADGIEALELAGRHTGSIDLVLTDVVMPRMNGRELVDELVTRRPRTKVLLTSGYPDPLTRRDLANGHRAFIQKPYVVEELLTTIRRLLTPA